MILSLSLPGRASPALVSPGRVFLGWTLSPSVHPTTLPIDGTDGWTGERRGIVRTLSEPQRSAMERIGR